MSKKILIIPLVLIIGIIGVLMMSDSSVETFDLGYHVTLADPDLYQDGVYRDSIEIEGGTYMFSFVPNGSSPKVLTIMLSGESLEFSEAFELRGILQETGISEYHTWEYDGQKTVVIPETQVVDIMIDPNGNVGGSVSVSLVKEA